MIQVHGNTNFINGIQNPQSKPMIQTSGDSFKAQF